MFNKTSPANLPVRPWRHSWTTPKLKKSQILMWNKILSLFSRESGNKFKFFLFQAILFYVPRWLWKNWEAGKVSALRMDLNLGIISEVEKKLKKKLLIDYMYSNLKHHNFWAYRYFFCEFLSLINVGGKGKELSW